MSWRTGGPKGGRRRCRVAGRRSRRWGADASPGCNAPNDRGLARNPAIGGPGGAGAPECRRMADQADRAAPSPQRARVRTDDAQPGRAEPRTRLRALRARNGRPRSLDPRPSLRLSRSPSTPAPSHRVRSHWWPSRPREGRASEKHRHAARPRPSRRHHLRHNHARRRRGQCRAGEDHFGARGSIAPSKDSGRKLESAAGRDPWHRLAMSANSALRSSAGPPPTTLLSPQPEPPGAGASLRRHGPPDAPGSAVRVAGAPRLVFCHIKILG